MPILFNNGGDLTQYVTFPDSAQYVLSTQITLCCWMYVVDWPIGTSMYNDFLSRNANYMLSGNNSSPRGIRFQYYNGSGYNTLNCTAEFPINTWLHAAVTFNSNAAENNCIIYKNGYSTDSTRFTDAIANLTGNMNVGRLGESFSGQPKRYFHGAIDDARLYNRALTNYEIRTIFSLKGTDKIREGLKFRTLLNRLYHTEVATGADNLKDISEYSNNGTPNNSPYFKGSILQWRDNT